MNRKQNETYDAEKAVTRAFDADEIVRCSGFGDVTWGEWCRREKARMNATGGGGRVRIARGGGLVWLTRG